LHSSLAFFTTINLHSFFVMKLLLHLSTLLGLSAVAAAYSGAAAFDKVKKPVIEKRQPDQPFANPELQKRASQFATSKTQSTSSPDWCSTGD